MVAWGWQAWGPSVLQCCHAIGQLGIKQIACGELWMLILTQEGRLLTVQYSSDAQVQERVGDVDLAVA